MEYWMLFTLGSAICAGLNAFVLKIIAAEGYNKDYIFFMRYVIGVLLALILYVSTVNSFEAIYAVGVLFIVLAFCKAITSYIVSYSKVKSLENIDTTIFLPLYKTLTLLSITSMSIFFFGEDLGVKEFCGILIGLCVPFFLINEKESKKQTNMKRGLIYVLIGGISACFSASINKYVNVVNFNIELFSIIFLAIGIVISYCKYLNTLKRKKQSAVITKKDKHFALIAGFLVFGATYLFLKALTGNLAVVYTINSFSILIPIILSVIFYKEEMTYKKVFVIFLSIVSVILFI